MAAEQNDLRVSVQEPQSWSRRLSITVPRERVQRTRTSVTSRLAGNLRLPGFRKGHTPRSLVEKQFGAQIEQETLDRLIQEAYREALSTTELNPITQGQVGNIQYEPGTELTFDVEFEVQPAVTLDRVGGFVVARPSAEVGEEEVDSILERIRAERAVLHPVEDGSKPDWGDEVTVEITDRDAPPAEGEDAASRTYRFALGEGQAIPDVEEAIMTLAPGEEADFDVRFPEDFPDEAQRGQEQHLHIKLTSLGRRELPEADDEFARSLGDFEDMAALRARVLDDLRADASRRAEAAVRDGLLGQLLEANPFDVPQSMVERYIAFSAGLVDNRGNERQLTPEQAEQFSQYREIMRPQAEATVKRMLVVETLADREGLRATEDDLDARVQELAEKNGRTPTDVWLELERSGQLQALENEITEDKVFDYLKSQSTVS
jgi:trigger factor